jgi:hypothetical protein
MEVFSARKAVSCLCLFADVFELANKLFVATCESCVIMHCRYSFEVKK